MEPWELADLDPPPAALAGPLLAWFAEHARELPWRGTREPYEVWVSEVMLQQTQVDTVRRYYAGFLERFPTLAELAAAEEDEVLAAWSGLGFYRRARNLHRAAQVALAEYGELPRDPAALGELPGLGRYTVGAVLSIACEARLPILDGNVTRVLSRVFRVEGDPSRSPTKRRLWALAEAVLPADQVGDFNQSLMELGALVCRPQRPACASCPLEGLCGAGRAGDPTSFPTPGPRAKVLEVARAAVQLVAPDGRFLVEQRPRSGLLAAMWELPAVELAAEESGEEGARRVLRRLGARGRLQALGSAEHRFSHRHWTTEVFRARTRARALLARGTWVDPAALAELAVPTATRKVLRVAGVPDPA